MRTGISTDTVFTRARTSSTHCPGKKVSYDTLASNIKAGTALKDAGEITAAADVTLWNGSVYPDAQPAAVKRAARQCDFLTFIGRGYVQITGRANYTKFSNKLAHEIYEPRQGLATPLSRRPAPVRRCSTTGGVP